MDVQYADYMMYITLQPSYAVYSLKLRPHAILLGFGEALIMVGSEVQIGMMVLISR